MPFPALTKLANGALTSEATGVPDDGVNVITTNLDLNAHFAPGPAPAAILDPNFLKIEVSPGAAPGVSGFTFVSAAADFSTVTLDFRQTAPGVGNCTVRVSILNTDAR